MTPEEVNKTIQSQLRIRNGDTLPFVNHRYRHTRKSLAKIFNIAGYKYGAEIGVRSGYYSKVLFNHINGLKLICVDPWVSYKAIEQVPQEIVDQTHDNCLRRLKGLDVEYMKMTSMEAVKQVPDKSLDFVYIDGLHEFDDSMMDIIRWSPKVRTGGIVSGRNYFAFYRSGAMMAVDAYTYAHNINEWYVVTADKYPSYFWVQMNGD
jgi:hypothetical protein